MTRTARNLRWALLVIVASAVIGKCSPATHAQSEGAKPARLLDIRKAAADAELIVIGSSSFEKMYAMTVRGTRAGPPIAYRVEVWRFLKGTDQYARRNGKRLIEIPSGSRFFSDGSDGPTPTLPEPGSTSDGYIYFLRLKRAGWPSYPDQLPLTPDSWFIPATEDNVRAVREAIPLPAEWGRPSDGLQLGIRPTKNSYRSGQPVDVDICVRNVSDCTITLPQQRVAASDCYPFTDFYAETEIRRVPTGGYSLGRRRWVHFSKPRDRREGSALPPVSLEPGEVYIERVRLDSWQWTTLDGLSPFASGTRWMLKACFDTRDADASAAFLPHLDLWKGRVESQFIELRMD